MPVRFADFGSHGWAGIISLVLLVSLFVASGCGVEFSSPSSAPPGDPRLLAGTWAGSVELAGPPRTGAGITIVFSSAGQITSITDSTGYYSTAGIISGLVEGVVGDTRLFLVTFNNGKEAGLYTDSAFTHGGFLDENFNVAVIQKGATEPAAGGPAYAPTALDTGGPITSKFINIDATFTITPGGSSTVEVNSAAPPYLQGSDTEIGVFESNDLTLVAPDYGLFIGTIFNNPAGLITAGAFAAMPTPDLSYAGSYACNDGNIVFGNCGFRVWNY